MYNAYHLPQERFNILKATDKMKIHGLEIRLCNTLRFYMLDHRSAASHQHNVTIWKYCLLDHPCSGRHEMICIFFVRSDSRAYKF